MKEEKIKYSGMEPDMKGSSSIFITAETRDKKVLISILSNPLLFPEFSTSICCSGLFNFESSRFLIFLHMFFDGKMFLSFSDAMFSHSLFILLRCSSCLVLHSSSCFSFVLPSSLLVGCFHASLPRFRRISPLGS